MRINAVSTKPDSIAAMPMTRDAEWAQFTCAMASRRAFLKAGLAAAAVANLPAAAFAATLDYALEATQIAPDTYAVYGAQEQFSVANGGNIVNTAFVVTDEGVVVIDTGPSLRYGEALKALIRKVANRDVVRVYITHHHPDHMLGNQAFEPSKLASTETVIANINSEGEMFAGNMYRLVGDWMRGTEVRAPGTALTTSHERFGDHEFEIIPLAGHTSSDLVILDKTTGVLFAGDLAFLDRAATTPHADIAVWQQSLDQLDKSPFKLLMPGHGPAEESHRAIEQTRAYLTWLDRTLKTSIRNGEDMTEAMASPIPQEFRSIALVRDELGRSTSHLYPKYEEQMLPLVSGRS